MLVCKWTGTNYNNHQLHSHIEDAKEEPKEIRTKNQNNIKHKIGN